MWSLDNDPFWDSIEAIKGVAGPNPDRANVERCRAVLTSFDDRVGITRSAYGDFGARLAARGRRRFLA